MDYVKASEPYGSTWRPIMELCDMVQSNMDPYLFIGNKVMAIIYVDYILF